MMAKLYKIKIPLDTVVKILNAIDVDEDKCISVGELYDYVKLLIKKAKKLAKKDKKEEGSND